MKIIFTILFLCSAAVSQQAASAQSSRPSQWERPDLWILQPLDCHGGELCYGTAKFTFDEKRWQREQRAKRRLAKRGAQPATPGKPAEKR